MKNSIKTLTFFYVFFALSLYSNDKIVIGTIDTEVQEKIYKFNYLAKYLEKELKKHNIKFDVEIPKSISTAIDFINHDKLHIYIDSLYPSLLIRNETDLEIVCKRWKKNQEGYKSIIFVKKDSDIISLGDLKGKTIAFEDEFSTSSFYIPKNRLESLGYKVSTQTDADVRYMFSRSEDNSATWVLFKKVDAAVTDNGTYEKYDKDLFKKIYTSKIIPRHLVSFSKKVDKKTQKKILDVLYNMDKTKEGRDVLYKFSKTKKFSPLNNTDKIMVQKL